MFRSIITNLLKQKSLQKFDIFIFIAYNICEIDFISYTKRMADNSIQKQEINENNAAKKRSFFWWNLNNQSKDLLDFRYNTQEEIDKLNENMQMNKELNDIISDNETEETIASSQEEEVHENNENSKDDLDWEGILNNKNSLTSEEEGIENKNTKDDELIDNNPFENEPEDSEILDDEPKFFDPFELNFDEEESEEILERNDNETSLENPFDSYSENNVEKDESNTTEEINEKKKEDEEDDDEIIDDIENKEEEFKDNNFKESINGEEINEIEEAEQTKEREEAEQTEEREEAEEAEQAEQAEEAEQAEAVEENEIEPINENGKEEITEDDNIDISNEQNETNDHIEHSDNEFEWAINGWENNIDEEDINLTDEEIFEQEPEFFADDELSQQFYRLVQISRDIFNIEHKNWENNPYYKIIWGKTENEILEYFLYLIEQEDEPIDLFIKKLETNKETWDEIEHLVQFSYDMDKNLNVFVDEVILYEKVNKSEKDTQQRNDTKSILEKFIFLAQTYYDELKSELERKREEKEKKKKLQNIFKWF